MTTHRGPLRGFFGILSGSAVAQLLAVFAVPLLARLYGPADTAHYTYLLGVSAVLTSIAALRLDLAVPLPQADEVGRQLFWLAVGMPLITLPAIGLAAGLVTATTSWRPARLSAVDVAATLLFVVVLCFFTAATQLAIRLRAYGLLGRIPVIQMVGTLAAQAGLGAVRFRDGLFVGGVVGRSLGAAGLMRACDVRPSQAPSSSEARRLLRTYWRFPLVFAPAAFVEVLGSNAAVLMLPGLFGLEAAGLYALAIRVSAVPGAVVTQAAGQVFLGEFSRAESRDRAVRVFFRWSLVLAGLGAAVAVAIWFLAPVVLPRVLGSEWDGAVRLAQYTGVMAGAAMVGSPVQHVWTMRQHGFMQLGWNVTRLGAIVGAIWFAAEAGASIAEAVSVLVLATCGTYLLAWLGCWWSATRSGVALRSTLDRPVSSSDEP